MEVSYAIDKLAKVGIRSCDKAKITQKPMRSFAPVAFVGIRHPHIGNSRKR
jgi:hypothetical protein